MYIIYAKGYRQQHNISLEDYNLTRNTKKGEKSITKTKCSDTLLEVTLYIFTINIL